MTGKRTPFSRLLHRTATSLVAAAALVTATALWAPAVHATPESDAADAITAKWQEAGGDGSVLGAPDGAVYAAGAGFGQNFAGGAIFFTPATQAKIMSGAILEKYRALGGPADSDLGFPTIDEGPGRVSPESRNTTFSAPDNPVIFWTPETGAWLVRGAINTAWDKLGGSAGALGVPTSDQTQDGNVATQKFSAGQLSFDTSTGTFTTEPAELAGQLTGLQLGPPSAATAAIDTAWQGAGGEAGPLGAKAGEQYQISEHGAGQDFAGGKIYYHPDTGAQVVAGAILTKYETAGGPTGDLGFPTAAEADGGAPDSRVQSFAADDRPVIFWTPEHGALIVRGAIKAAWDKLGGAAGALGVPIGESSADGAATTQAFAGGTVSWDAQSRSFSTEPAELAAQLGDVEVPAATTAETPGAPGHESGAKYWWLWWLVPLALLLLGGLWAWRSRRRAAQADVVGVIDARHPLAADDRDDHDDGYDEGYDEGPAGRYDRGYDEPAGADEHWAGHRANGDRDRYAEPEGDTEYLSSRPGWTDRSEDETTTEYRRDPADDPHALFTHHGAHEAEEVEDRYFGGGFSGGDFEDRDFDGGEDSDAIDTAPTRIVDDAPSGRHSAISPEQVRSVWTAPDDDVYLPGPGSLFAPVYGAVPPPEPESDEPSDVRSGQYGADDEYESETTVVVTPGSDTSNLPAIHLPLADPNQAPEGYPIKGSMRTGTYYLPGTIGYQQTVAEIWFASPVHAEANGFHPAA